MPGSQGFVSPIVTAKSSLGELFGAYDWMRIAGGPLNGNPPKIAVEPDSILRIKIAGFVERLTVPSKKDRKSTASILGLKARVAEQATTNDDVMMEPATGPET
jgi:hypothetical protein